MLTVQGKIRVNCPTIKVILNNDFCEYYRTLAGRTTWIKFGKPLHTPHISVILPRFATRKNWHWQQYQKYDNQKIELKYDPTVYFGGFEKGFLAIYAHFYSQELRKMFHIKGKNYFHCTLGTTKNHQNKDFTFWPPLLTIK